ncbi:AbrB/MazE/SpoVT family DNA-binding domain-containing protein [Nocardia rhamnosiphila]|uniref:AbrB/MazE/SpoVT family DNA-binding domain-containing protein n=1 Tax=Nocardia rhamnosiphila TaxID=426716 RepID=UPI000A56F815|nr:AbrB/MazE/SpoVT family DNA-binding domain-containing protein [Nocardia rhamnosiphila]
MSMAEELFEGLYLETTPTPTPVSDSLVTEFAFPDTFDDHVPTDLYCSVTAMDNRGRLAARATVRQLNWQPGQTVSMTLQQGMIVIRRAPQGCQLPTSGFVVLPSRVRNRCGLYPGDRVLVVASPSVEILAVLPPRILAAALLANCPELRRSES